MSPSQDTGTKFQQFYSPIGTFMWPKLLEPDRKFDAEGRYQVTLRLDAEAGVALHEELKKAYEEGFAEFVAQNPKKKNIAKVAVPGRKVLDEEGNETGEWDFSFGMKALAGKPGGNRWEQRPVIADAKGNRPDPKTLNIGSGSVGRVCYTRNCYNNKDFGLSLKLVGVQITKLKEGRAPVNFDPVEDGWTAEAAGGEGGDY